MGDFIYFTEEQKERANAVPIMDILKREHEEVERSGNEWRWKRHGSVTFRGNRWYRHSQQMGSHAIDFMQEFFGMSYPEAVTYLLDGETGQVIHGGSPPRETTGKKSVRPKEEKIIEEKEPKVLIPPEKNDTMKRVYAYLMQKSPILSEYGRQNAISRRCQSYIRYLSITRYAGRQSIRDIWTDSMKYILMGTQTQTV